jgi:hypothetical protein
MTDKHTQIVQPDGGENHIVIIDFPCSDLAREFVKSRLMTELFHGLRLRADVFDQSRAEVW